MPLTPEQQNEAMRAIALWRAAKEDTVACPACSEPGLAIIDRSARPHAEWYALSCSACGMDETLHIALGAAIPTLD
jgi:hypothetical protein